MPERLIKKYPNRRLYDTEASRYITLTEVKQLIMADQPFKVVDSNTDQDLTRSILLQIIMDQEAGGEPLFTTDMLARFIRFHGDPGQATLTSFLEQGLDLMFKQQRLAAEQVKKAAWPFNPIDFWTQVGQQNLEYWRQFDAQRGTDEPPRD
ncbi:MAG: polyhydroxyalkanoate synthesis repressor PhaR [Pseudomonadota bacterium]